MSAPKQKLEILREAWAAGDKLGALRVASKFHDRSPETKAFQRGWDALNNAAFYRQMGKDPEALAAAAYQAMAKKFALPL